MNIVLFSSAAPKKEVKCDCDGYPGHEDYCAIMIQKRKWEDDAIREDERKKVVEEAKELLPERSDNDEGITYSVHKILDSLISTPNE